MTSYQKGRLFTAAYQTARARIRALLQPYDLTIASWSMLSIAVQSKQKVTPKTIATDIGVKLPLITLLSNELIRRGLLSTEPNPGDKRSKFLVPTIEGVSLYTAIEPVLLSDIDKMLGNLTREQRDALKAALGAIANLGKDSVEISVQE